MVNRTFVNHATFNKLTVHLLFILFFSQKSGRQADQADSISWLSPGKITVRQIVASGRKNEYPAGEADPYA
jgi:hypothetical protein